jgi:D-amino-acid dehydrogenase
MTGPFKKVERMQVAVVGAGVTGVSTAYFLAEAGHEVVVVERRNNVAEEASFGDAGLMSYDSAMPLALPGMPRALLSALRKPASPIFFRRLLDPALWRWIRRWRGECEAGRYQRNHERMLRLSLYSRELMQSLRERHQLDYEQNAGCLQLLRSERDVQLMQSVLQFLGEQGIAHKLLDADMAHKIEPALHPETPLASALYFPQDESGNCPLFTRQMRQLTHAMGVQFHFGSEVETIRQTERGVALQIGEQQFAADAVVLASGADSVRLLAPLGIQLPFQRVRSVAVTAPVRNFDAAPTAALFDHAHQVAITRLDKRVRVAGTLEFGVRNEANAIRDAALHTLFKVAEDWFPQACNFHSATFWSGSSLMLPDGPPVVGATAARGVFVNLGHGTQGWTMATGAAKLVADLVSMRDTDIDTEGLTPARYS